jgi:hypothetical protein
MRIALNTGAEALLKKKKTGTEKTKQLSSKTYPIINFSKFPAQCHLRTSNTSENAMTSLTVRKQKLIW